jgi:hypothetical protein
MCVIYLTVPPADAALKDLRRRQEAVRELVGQGDLGVRGFEIPALQDCLSHDLHRAGRTRV